MFFEKIALLREEFRNLVFEGSDSEYIFKIQHFEVKKSLQSLKSCKKLQIYDLTDREVKWLISKVTKIRD